VTAGDSSFGANVLTFLRNILFQLLDQNVGDVKLYQQLQKTFEQPSIVNDMKKLEENLWKGLEIGLRVAKTRKLRVVIVVDGLDEIIGRKPAEFHESLRNCVQKCGGARAIILSRPISHISEGCKHLVITREHTQNDIKLYLRQKLEDYICFTEHKLQDQEKFLSEMSQKSKGSFLWAYLVVKLLLKETTHSGFNKVVESITSDLRETMEKVIAKINLKNDTTRLLIEFMLVARMPLSNYEITDLLRVNVKRKEIEEATDICKHISNACSDIIVVQKGYVHFKHSAIRDYMQSLMGKLLHAAKDVHLEITLRVLLYTNLRLRASSEICFEEFDDRHIRETFNAHVLLRYAIQNWLFHFRSSSLCGSKSGLSLSPDFKAVFPNSSAIALLENACWYHASTPTEVLERRNWSLKIRAACFGEKHITVLQDYILLGNLHCSMSKQFDGAEYYYKAFSIGQHLFDKFGAVVVNCITYFLRCTTTVLSEKSTTVEITRIIEYREIMIRRMIEICVKNHGRESVEVIHWHEVLYEFYVTIKETKKAMEIYKELHKIIIIVYGATSTKARNITGQLAINFNGCDHDHWKDGEIDEYIGTIFETSEELEEDDEVRITVLISLALSYEMKKMWFEAEMTYVELWRRISEICRVKHTVELHRRKLEIVLKYVKFLKLRQRVEEATNILICLWAEHEQYGFEDETIIICIRDIANFCKRIGLLKIALSMLIKVWEWSKHKGGDGHMHHDTTILITEVIEEITETEYEVVETREYTETVTKEIFETHYHRCKGSKTDATFYKACMALVGFYLKQKNWAEVEIVIKRSLEISWKAILTVNVDIDITGEFIEERIILVRRLAECYRYQYCFEKAEDLYLRIYRGCFRSCHIESKELTQAIIVLIKFYEEHHRHSKVIEIYIEVLGKYKKLLGHTHEMTIRTLYALAEHYKLLSRKEAYEYYYEIIVTLNKGNGHCHPRAFDAAVILCEYYHTEKRWKELQQICEILWKTFVHHRGVCGFTPEIIEVIYQRYSYVLEIYAKVQFSVLYKLSIEFHETVTVTYGVSHLLLVALMALAKLCEKRAL
jgi:tetratricopeptide (TPR) repeat protein